MISKQTVVAINKRINSILSVVAQKSINRLQNTASSMACLQGGGNFFPVALCGAVEYLWVCRKQCRGNLGRFAILRTRVHWIEEHDTQDHLDRFIIEVSE